MESKAFFQSVGQAREALQLLQEEREHYESMALSLGGMGDGTIRKSGQHSRVEAAAIRMSEITEKIDREAAGYVALLEQARGIIEQIPSVRQRHVLTMRYLIGLDWVSIAKRLDYQDIKSAFRVHGWALKAADDILRNQLPCDMMSKKE